MCSNKIMDSHAGARYHKFDHGRNQRLYRLLKQQIDSSKLKMFAQLRYIKLRVLD